MGKEDRPFFEQLGRNVQHFRLGRGWTQERLAEAAGRSHKVIGALERGRTNPKADLLRDVAAGLSINIGDLFAPIAGTGAQQVVVFGQDDIDRIDDHLERALALVRAAKRARSRRRRGRKR